MRTYSDPSRESDPYALPDVEVWSSRIVSWPCCDTESPEEAETCPTCDRDQVEPEPTGKRRFFYAYGFPGCLNDSEPFGPFETEEAAIAAAREDV